MNWMLEDPLPIAMLGLLAVAILGGAWIRTGARWLVFALAAVILLTGVLLLVERGVVTYREQVEATLRQCAADVETNDLELVLRHVHPDAKRIRSQVEAEFPRYHFDQVTIARNLEITVQKGRQPPRAIARFNAIVVGSDRASLIQNQRVARYVEVTFQRDEEDGQWKIIRYAHYDVGRAFTTRKGPPGKLPDLGP